VNAPLSASPSGVAALEARHLTLHRGRDTVLDDVGLAWSAGTWTAVVGPNGAGKSTLLQALAGLLPLASGEVRLQGRALGRWPASARARALAWLSQHAQAQGELPVREVVALGRLPHHGLFGTCGPGDAQAVEDALALTDCLGFAERPLGALSGGERQRVLLARAFAVQAPVLLLDEPTAHLDAPHTLRLVRHLRACAQAGGTVVTVLHDLTLALAADRVVVLRGGRVHADGAPDAPALHAALAETFEHAVQVQAVGPPQARRWVALVEAQREPAAGSTPSPPPPQA
jgi:iron complex transport system ATP-binding protein